MDKQLTAYYKEMKQKITDDMSAKERESLRGYHYQRVAEFQHERFIHLLVTLFFGGLLLAAFGGLFVILYTAGDLTMFLLLVLLVAILTVLEMAYIQYYYRLENGTQQLYELTERLH
jgi:hypothetical protein